MRALGLQAWRENGSKTTGRVDITRQTEEKEATPAGEGRIIYDGHFHKAEPTQGTYFRVKGPAVISTGYCARSRCGSDKFNHIGMSRSAPR